MIVGIDMVMEEDYNDSISAFLPQLYEGHQKFKKDGREFNMMLHAGESNSKNNKELYYAINLGTKRIGHGIHLAHCPSLMKIVKEKEICLEVCPISNFILGYTLDLRCHPARGFLHAGLPVAICSDDPGFWGYDGLTLDYVYAFLAWDLDLADLKQLAINSLTYSSVAEGDK